MDNRKGIIAILLFLVSAFAFSNAFAQEIEYKEYKVLQGDTLWDISSREFDEKNPFLWPKIWKENPEIPNPDKIYPNQKIKIPVRILQKEPMPLEEVMAEKAAPSEVKMEAKAEEPPKPVERKIIPLKQYYLADKDLLMSSLYITDYLADEIKNLGKITGSSSGKTIFGVFDEVYIKTKNPARKGEKFYVVRSTEIVKHPKTGVKIGHLVTVPGIIEIVGEENNQTKAKIIKSYIDIRLGDVIDTYYEVEPLMGVMGDDSPRKPNVSGYVIAANLTKGISGNYDIVLIDKGSKNGLVVGDALKVLSFDKYTKSRTSGVIYIIKLNASTSTAIIKESESAISKGDEVVGLK